jgi:hypothetical protein
MQHCSLCPNFCVPVYTYVYQVICLALSLGPYQSPYYSGEVGKQMGKNW